MGITSVINITLDAFCIVLNIILIGCLRYGKSYRSKLHNFFVMLLIVNLILSTCSMVSWMYNGSFMAYTYLILVVSNFVLYFCWYAIRMYASVYLFTYASFRTKVSARFPIVFYSISLLSIILLITSQFTGWIYYINEENFFQRGNLYWIAYVGPALLFLLDLILLYMYRKEIGAKDRKTFIIFELLPMISLVLLLFNNGVLFLNVGLTLSLLILYIRIQIEGMNQLELEISKSRISIMLSQIRPHFLYNSLVAIQNLCYNDPKMAGKAVGEFSHYLRSNLDSLMIQKLIPFEKELQHTKLYLSLEKMRFEDKLNIVYEIYNSSFFIPALTLQPIVENAVRHGINKRIGGGTVTIRTEETQTHALIIVSDDGVGFIPNDRSNQDERTHVGLENVRSRLMSMCGGSLSVTSIQNSGTTVTIAIPKKWGGEIVNEYYSRR